MLPGSPQFSQIQPSSHRYFPVSPMHCIAMLLGGTTSWFLILTSGPNCTWHSLLLPCGSLCTQYSAPLFFSSPVVPSAPSTVLSCSPLCTQCSVPLWFCSPVLPCAPLCSLMLPSAPLWFCSLTLPSARRPFVRRSHLPTADCHYPATSNPSAMSTKTHWMLLCKVVFHHQRGTWIMVSPPRNHGWRDRKTGPDNIFLEWLKLVQIIRKVNLQSEIIHSRELTSRGNIVQKLGQNRCISSHSVSKC